MGAGRPANHRSAAGSLRQQADDGKPHYNRPADGPLHSPPWAPTPAAQPRSDPAGPRERDRASGLHDPRRRLLPRHVIDPVSRVKGVDVVYTTSPSTSKSLPTAGFGRRLRGFQILLRLGTWAGDFYRDSDSAANKAVLAERLEVPTGAQRQEQLDTMRAAPCSPSTMTHGVRARPGGRVEVRLQALGGDGGRLQPGGGICCFTPHLSGRRLLGSPRTRPSAVVGVDGR